ncbi:MAG: hypothetical protein M5U31_01015 [Acidimicrobiia bacterium]|nr:hypothetical protein [Acidimicrobiia bacterium]
MNPQANTSRHRRQDRRQRGTGRRVEKTVRIEDKIGNYRWYNRYALPAEYGDATITVRLHSTADDTDRGLNRTENVRPIPPTDPDFTDLFRRRNGAESINRAFDDTLYLHRAHSIGHPRQHRTAHHCRAAAHP